MRIPITVLFSILLLSCAPRIVTFSVSVPPDTDTVVVVGNTIELGNWDHDQAIPLEKISDTTYSVSIPLKPGTYIEYKFTRGAWDKEALAPDSTIPGNHTTVISRKSSFHHKIPLWRDQRHMIQIDRTAGTTGHIDYIDMYSPQLDNSRTVSIWLPPSYETEPNISYPVLYLHDGQNVFSPWWSVSGNEWHLDETVTEFIEQGKMRDIIMVAVDHGDRRGEEYSPMNDGTLYSAFLIETVKPLIDSTFRTLSDPKNTAVMGASMGGIISFHLGWEHPDVFGIAGCLSPAFIVDDEEIVNRVKEDEGPIKPTRFYIYNGTEELDAELQPSVLRMVQALENKGYYKDQDFFYRVFDGAYHTELAWAEQSKLFLLGVFGLPM